MFKMSKSEELMELMIHIATQEKQKLSMCTQHVRHKVDPNMTPIALLILDVLGTSFCLIMHDSGHVNSHRSSYQQVRKLLFNEKIVFCIATKFHRENYYGYIILWIHITVDT